MSTVVSKPIKHPARFSPEIIEVMKPILQDAVRVHDPFAGTGERLGKLIDSLSPRPIFSGTEIEASFIVDPRVRHGNSKDFYTYPRAMHYTICTSPVYPNGMADSWEAKDGSKRNTYRAAVKENEGQDRELDPDNMGMWGYRGTTPRSAKREAYWDLARKCAENWHEAGRIVLNVSDFMVRDDIEPVVEPWIALLEDLGWHSTKVIPVRTQRNRHGSDASRDQRVDHEMVIVMERASAYSTHLR